MRAETAHTVDETQDEASMVRAFPKPTIVGALLLAGLGVASCGDSSTDDASATTTAASVEPTATTRVTETTDDPGLVAVESLVYVLTWSGEPSSKLTYRIWLGPKRQHASMSRRSSPPFDPSDSPKPRHDRTRWEKGTR